jgi:hypothetical protein
MRPTLAAVALAACLVASASAGPPPPVIVLPMTARRAPPLLSSQKHHHPHHRRLASAAWPLSGDAGETGVFTVPLSIGTPPQTLEAIVDTGSTLTAFTCAGCALGECGTSHGVFDPDASSSAARLACTDAACACGTPACTCGAGDACAYRRVYAESSSTSGVMVADALAVPGAVSGNTTTSTTTTTARLVFGCATHETGSIHAQPAAGIAGLGAADAGLVDQLAAAGAIAGPAFSLCLQPPPDDGDGSKARRGGGAGGGALVLGPGLPPGAEAVPGTVTTPLVSKGDTSFYIVRLAGLAFGGLDAPPLEMAASAGGESLAPTAVLNGGAGVVLDSGTTFTYLPTPAYVAAVAAADGAAAAAGLDRVPGADPAFEDVCWGGGSSFASSAAVIAAFPNLTLAFDGGRTDPAPLTLPPRSFLFPHPSKKRAACLGLFDNKADGTILGGITFLDTLVQIDRMTTAGGGGGGSLGVARFVPGVDCGALGRDAAAGLAGGGALPLPPSAQRGAAVPGGSRSSRTTAWVAVLATIAALMVVGAAAGALASRRAGGEGGDGPARASCWPWSSSSRQWEAFEGQGTAAGALGLAAPVVAGAAAAPPSPPPRPVVLELGSVGGDVK